MSTLIAARRFRVSHLVLASSLFGGLVGLVAACGDKLDGPDPCAGPLRVEQPLPRSVVIPDSLEAQVLAVVPSGPGPDVVDGVAPPNIDSLNRVITTIAGARASLLLVRIVLDSTRKSSGHLFQRLWAATMLSARDSGVVLIDRALGSLFVQKDSVMEVSENGLLALSALSHVLLKSLGTPRTPLPGTLTALCALRAASTPDLARGRPVWLHGNVDYLLATSAAELLAALENHDAGGSKQRTEAVLTHWRGIVLADSIRAHLTRRP